MTTRIGVIAAVLLSTVATVCAQQDRFLLGSNAYEDGLYVEAAGHWLQSAEAGHGPSQFNLGILYEQALGVEQDFAEALRWYTLAAKNGVSDAAFSVANILLVGTQATPRSVDQAIYWYVQAADAGHADAQFKLGSMFIAGEDVPEDVATGVSWLELAAANHHVEATSLLRRLAEQHQGAVLGEDWLVQQNPDLFTVELYSAPTLAMAHEFVLVLELESAAVYASGADRYHVVVGTFDSDSAAKLAIEALPVALRARVPKVRRIGQIQQQLTQFDSAAVNGATADVSVEPLQGAAVSQQAVPAPPPIANVQVNDEAWIRSRDPDRYTAVLFSASDESNARSFVAKAGLAGGAIYQSSDGKFRVLGGLFENQQEAENAIARLPAQIKALSPRPAKFSNIFQEMVNQ